MPTPAVPANVRGSTPAPRDDDAGGTSVRTMARGGTLGIAGAVIGGVFSFAMPMVVTRGTPSTAAAGAFFTGVAVYTLLARITHLGADVGLVRFIARHRALEDPGAIRPLLRAGLLPAGVVATVAGLAVMAFAAPLARLVGSPDEARALTDYLRILGLFAPIGALMYATLGATRGFGTMRPTVVANDLVRPTGQLVLVGAAILLAPTPLWLGLGYVVPVAAALAVAVTWLLRLRSRVAVSGGLPPVPWSEFWRFSLPRSVSGVFAVVLSWLDVLLLGALASTSAAGVYAALTRYLVVGTTLQSAMTRAFQPEMTRLLTIEDHDAARRLFQTATGWSMMLTWPAYVVMILHAPALLRVFGEEYVVGRPAMVILAAAWMLGTALGPVDAVLMLSGRSALSMMNLGIALTVNLALNVVLIPSMGITGAAWAWFASILTHNLLPLVQVWTSLRLHPFGRHTVIVGGLATVSFAGLTAAGRAWVGTGAAGLAVGVLGGGVTYLAGLALLRDSLALPTLLRSLRGRRGARATS